MKDDLKKNEAEENQEKRSSTLVRLTKWKKKEKVIPKMGCIW